MTKDLFIRYLQGNCTAEEFEQLLCWIRESASNSSGKGIVEEIWNEFEPEAGLAERIKYNRILDKIHHTINISQTARQLEIQKTPFQNRLLTLLTRAAALLLIPVLSLFLYTHFSDKNRQVNNLSDLEVEAPAGSRVNMKLGDGTVVWLNHGSKLKYPYRFEGKNRKVFLTGEAFFVVAHNKKVPFIVATDRLEVKATGTTFNVSAYPEDTLVETTLVEGKVTLYESQSDKEIRALVPDECLKYNSKGNTYFLESGNTEKYTAWKDGLLIFKNDPVEVIAKKLGRWFNADVEITNERAKAYTCTATFSDETLPQVLELLTLPTPVSFKLLPMKKLPDGSLCKPKVLIGIKK